MSVRYEAAKRVVANSQAEELPEGVLLDLFSASALVAVFEALAPRNQARFDELPIDKLVGLAFKAVAA